MDDHIIEKKISPLIASQFPAFYNEEGPVFIQFVKAYYEWLESEDQTLYKSRRILENTDIDTTLEKFLEYFQKKYLYGIPFDVIINKRFLLKHVLDAYRSKGSIQCFKLLFRLIYNLDVDVYLPGVDMLRISDGTWVEPRYIEVNNVPILGDLVGKTIVGLTSGTTAVVESYITEPFNENILSVLYLSNIIPDNGDFVIGEKVIEKELRTANNLFEVVQAAPTVLGSLDYIEIINGGSEFATGDLLKIVSKDLDTGAQISFGTEGIVRASEVGRAYGTLTFTIERPGSGVMANASVMVYNNPLDTTGQGGKFNVGTLTDTQIVSYNSDLLADYANTIIGVASYGMPGNTSANSDTIMGHSLTFANGTFGSVSSLTNVNTGNNYTAPVTTFVRSCLVSNLMLGNLSYTTSSATVTGTGTDFVTYLSNNSQIVIQANTANAATKELFTVKEVTNATSIILYGKPTINSTASARYRIAPSMLPANFATYDPIVFTEDSSISGLNVDVSGVPSIGNTVIKKTTNIRSGKGYVEGETIKMYLYGAVNTPQIIAGGTAYANGEQVVFSDTNPAKHAYGTVTTNTSGGITSITMADYGAGYDYAPDVLVRTANGSGAILRTTIREFDTAFEVTGKVVKRGTGRGRGYWSTSQGFLNADKYITDSYFYQDFSYQFKVAETLETYRDILYSTFHIAGTEMFGEFVQQKVETSLMVVLDEEVTIS